MEDPSSSSEDAAQQLTHWMVLCDRLLSSSTSDDVTVTLHSLYDRLNAVAKQKGNAELLSEMIEMMVLSEEQKAKEESSPILTTLYRIFTATYHLQIEDGTVDVGRIYVFLFHHANLRTSLALLSNGELISGCIDVATSTTIAEYGRVLALQILQRAGQVQPSTVQQQLLATPNGIARLGDLFSLAETPEQVQTALLQCTVAVLSQWASVAKIWIFHDILDAILKIAVQKEGGLSSSFTGGNAATVLDCITTVQQLLSHDTSMADLVFSSAQSMVVTSLCQLLDLRNASRFRNPTPAVKPTPAASHPSTRPSDAVDDLDDLIAAGSSQSRGPESPMKDTATQEPVDDRVVPLLTDMEEQIIDKVMDVLATVLENDGVRTMIWKQHAALGNLLWEMALLTKPPSSKPYPCGIPSVRLQQRALQVVATYFNSITILEEQLFAGMDRLFYLVCTGMGGAIASTIGEDAHRISQSALYVVRRTIPDALKNDMLMHALAPPPVDDPTQPLPASVSVVPKLLRTILDQLTITTNSVSLSGALGAVAIFIETSEVQRSILFRLTATSINGTDDATNAAAGVGTSSSLLNAILDSLIKELDTTSTTTRLEAVIPLLRFLCNWIMDTPEMVHVFLKAPSTLVLSQRLLSSTQQSFSTGDDMVQALISVLFGFCLMALPPNDDAAATGDGGGWTRGNVVALLQHPSIIAGLERVKTMPPPRVPWSYCTDEWRVWQDWYAQAVRVVRQRMVQEMIQRPAVGGGEEDTTWHGVVTEEAEQLRTELLESKRIIAAQEKQLATWKQRVESTPTELDTMLNDVTKKNADLDGVIQQLQSDMKRMEVRHAEELQQRDDAMEVLRQELATSRSQEDESRSERDALREDMTALSQAYSSLEVEYRRLTNPEMEQPTETEPSNASPSADIAAMEALQAENARMRQEAQDADEWMSMAVDRMQTMTNDINSLQEQVLSLTTQLESASSVVADGASAALLAQEREARTRLDEEVARLTQELSMVQGLGESSEAQIQLSRDNIETYAQKLNEVTAQRDQLQYDVSHLNQQLRDLQSPQRSDQLESSSSTDIVVLRKTVDDLHAQIAQIRAEMDSVLHREQMEVAARDARIQELDALLQDNEQLQRLQQELTQLNEANDAAQVWMSKAVEHHQLLTDQVASLSEQNADLQARLNEAALASNRNDSFNDQNMEGLYTDLENFKNVISQQQAQIDAFSEMERELSEVRSKLLSLQNEILSKDKEIESLKMQLTEPNLVNEYEVRSSLVESLQSELADKSEQVHRLTEEIEELRLRNKELVQKVDDLETVRIEAGTKEEEIRGLRARMAEAESRKEAIQNILDAVAKEKEELALEFNKNKHAMEEIESELNKVRRGDLDSAQSNEIEDSFEDLQNTIKTLEAQLVSQCDEATSVVQQWNETYAELQCSHDELESKLQASLDSKAQLERDLVEARQIAEKLQDELRVGQNSRISQLETLTENLKDQLSDQEQDYNVSINQWQDSYTEIESKLNAAVLENEALILQLEKAEERIQNELSMKHNEHRELLQRISNLEERLTHQEEEASLIVLQWQESYKNVESKFNEGVVENERLKSQLKTLHEKEIRVLESKPVDSSDRLSESNDDQMAELVLQIKNLEEQLAYQAQDALDTVQQWQESYEDVEKRLSTAMEENEKLKKEIQGIMSSETREKFIEGALCTESSNHQQRIHELEQAVKHLEEQLLSHEEEANSVVTQWQQCYNDAVSQHDTLLADLESTKKALEVLQNAHDAASLGMKSNADSYEQTISELKSTISSLQQQLSEHSAAAEHVASIQEHSDKVSSELEVVISDKISLEREVSNLLQKYESSEMEKKALLDDLGDLRCTLSSLQTKYDEISTSADLVARLEQRLADSDATNHDLQQQVDALNDIVNQWQESHGHVTEELKVTMLELQERRDASVTYQKQLDNANASAQNSHRELQEARNSIAENEAAIRIYSEQIKAQELEISSLQQRYAEAESLRKDSLTQSSESVADLESQLRIRDEDLRVLQENISVFQKSLEEKEAELVRLSSVLAEEREKSCSAIRRLETQLEDLEEDARSTVSEWQRSYEALQAYCEDSVAGLEESRKTVAVLRSQLDADKSGVAQTTSYEPSTREQALIAEIEELKDQIIQNSINPQETVSRWQAEYNEMESELVFAVKTIEELTAKVREVEGKESATDKQLSGSLLEKECAELRMQTRSLVASLGEASIAKEELIQEIEIVSKDAANLKDQLSSLNIQLEEMSRRNSLLQTAKATSEAELTQHLKTIETLRHEMGNLSREKCLLSEQVYTLTEKSVQVGAMQCDIQQMKEELESQLRIARSCNDQKDVILEELRRENVTLLHERDALLLQVADLEDKLSEANDTLQLLRTDLASKNAAEIAAEALREQVQSMYDQSQADLELIRELNHARDIAEAEADKLRRDLATCLGIDDFESNHAFIEGRVLEASQTLQRAERNEIASLRASLSRALDELANARSSEKELEERTAKATHQASLYEQELITTKSDFQFLTKTMDEMRESESSRRMSLEYRISSLENEQKVLRHYHTTEMDNVRNELNYVTIERDRLFQSLKESEKGRELLLHSSSRDILAKGGDVDPFVELNRLRMEKAQLLAAAANEASQSEYRIREAQASAKAAADAEILVERELRLQAEKNLERNVLEMAELRMVGMDHRHGSYNIEILEQRLESAQNEILRLKAESQSLSSDCNVLREQLQDSKKESNMTIARLTEECRQAKARASHLEREGRFDADVRIEVARIQAASSQSRSASVRSTPERSVVLRNKSTNNPALEHEDRDDEGISSFTASKMYDAVQKQKKELEEERIVYFGLLSEHDELLASYAQQELVKESFKRALKRQCGTEAVDAALQEAEEQAQMKYGKYVKLN